MNQRPPRVHVTPSRVLIYLIFLVAAVGIPVWLLSEDFGVPMAAVISSMGTYFIVGSWKKTPHD